MSCQAQITDELKKNLRSVLLSKSGGVELFRVEPDYRQLLREPLPYRQYGFHTVERFLQAVPDVAKYVSC